MTPEQLSLTTPEAEPAVSLKGDPSQSRTAGDIMNRSPRTCSKFSTVTEAVLIFKAEDCGMVPIVEYGKPIGVVTDRDVALSLAEHPDLVNRPVSEIMTTGAVTATPQTSLDQLAQIMAQQQVRRLLIVGDEGLLVGVVAWSDVAPFLPPDETGEMVAEVVEKS
jgi:CBS domain-containing protein